MTTIYEQHDAAFRHVSAYVVVKDGERVATIAFKFPVDGAGRLYAYVHWVGEKMVRGHASGGGYDKHSAACANAARKGRLNGCTGGRDMPEEHNKAWVLFWHALEHDGGETWDRRLRDAGFSVWQAV